VLLAAAACSRLLLLLLLLMLLLLMIRSLARPVLVFRGASFSIEQPNSITNIHATIIQQ